MSLFFFHSIYSQISFPKETDDRKIVSTLFEGNWSEKDSTCQWIPNLSESIQFGSDLKDTLRTKIDTIFNYKEDSFKKIILTSTYARNSDCHACQPSLGIIELSLNEETNVYQINQITKFITKYGTWGEAPKKRGLLQLGKDIYCVKITEYSGGMGREVGFTSLYKDGKKIFSFYSYDTNNDNVEFDSQKYKYSSSIFFDKKSNTIKITKKGKEFNDLGKIVKVYSISTYEYEGDFLTKKSTKNILTKK
jgi:hypothetical protein